MQIAVQRPVDIKNRPRIPIPDEDPYSIAGNGGGSSGSSGFGANAAGEKSETPCFYYNFSINYIFSINLFYFCHKQVM